MLSHLKYVIKTYTITKLSECARSFVYNSVTAEVQITRRKCMVFISDRPNTESENIKFRRKAALYAALKHGRMQL